MSPEFEQGELPRPSGAKEPKPKAKKVLPPVKASRWFPVEVDAVPLPWRDAPSDMSPKPTEVSAKELDPDSEGPGDTVDVDYGVLEDDLAVARQTRSELLLDNPQAPSVPPVDGAAGQDGNSMPEDGQDDLPPAWNKPLPYNAKSVYVSRANRAPSLPGSSGEERVPDYDPSIAFDGYGRPLQLASRKKSLRSATPGWLPVEKDEFPLFWRDAPSDAPSNRVEIAAEKDPEQRLHSDSGEPGDTVDNTILEAQPDDNPLLRSSSQVNGAVPSSSSKEEEVFDDYDPSISFDEYGRPIVEEPPSPKMPEEPETDEVGWGFKPGL